MQRRKICKLIGVILVVCMLFCGCSEKKPQMPAAEEQKIITMQMRMPNDFNPLLVENQSVRDALALCYEPLFAVDDKMQTVGVLAEEITFSDDCLTAIIKLKDSVMWHDNVKFTSADVVRTISLIKENPASPYYDCVSNIASAESIDPLSLRMSFLVPYGQAAYSLYFPIIASHNDNPEEKMIGTGPYAFESYAEAVLLKMKKNSNWHGGDPGCEKVEISIVRDNEVATSAFNTGSINTTTSYSFDSQNNTPRENSRLTQYPSLQYEFIMFNHKNEILSSPAVRAAISCAIDRSAIAAEAYVGAAMEANSPVHPASAVLGETNVGSQYNLAHAGETLFLEGYSINEATGLLQNEDEENLSFTLLVNKENTFRVNAAYQLCAQLFLAGIELKVEEVDFESYLKAIENNSYDIYYGGITFSNAYDFEFMLSAGGSLNKTEYTSETMNSALSVIASSTSDSAMSAALISFDEVFQREQPFCGIVFKNDTLITAENVKGTLKPYPKAPYINIAEWSVE